MQQMFTTNSFERRTVKGTQQHLKVFCVVNRNDFPCVLCEDLTRSEDFLRDVEPVSSKGDSRPLDLSTGHDVHARSMRSPIEGVEWFCPCWTLTICAAACPEAETQIARWKLQSKDGRKFQGTITERWLKLQGTLAENTRNDDGIGGNYNEITK
jgi:hypothetical protein